MQTKLSSWRLSNKRNHGCLKGKFEHKLRACMRVGGDSNMAVIKFSVALIFIRLKKRVTLHLSTSGKFICNIKATLIGVMGYGPQ